MARSIASKPSREEIVEEQATQLPQDVWLKASRHPLLRSLPDESIQIFEYCFQSAAAKWPKLLEKSASAYQLDERAIRKTYASLCVSRSHHALAKAFLYECVRVGPPAGFRVLCHCADRSRLARLEL